jgi:hypothetical protein
MGKAVGISLLSCTEAKICVISFLLPVNDRRVRFPTYPDVGQFSVGLRVLSDPGNMSIAVEIPLLSCIEAEIYVMSFLLPVNRRHLRFPTYPDVGQYSR